MKNLMAFAAALGMAMSVNLALPTVASAQSAQPAVDFCKANYEAFGFSSVGECVSLIRTSPVRACQYLKNNDYFPLDTYAPDGTPVTLNNQGQCVSFIRHL